MTSTVIVPLLVAAFVLVVIAAIVASYLKIKRNGLKSLPGIEELAKEAFEEPEDKCCCKEDCRCKKEDAVEEVPESFTCKVIVVDDDAEPKAKKPRKQSVKTLDKAIADLSTKIVKRTALLKSIKKPVTKDETLKGWKEKLANLKKSKAEAVKAEKDAKKAKKPAKKPAKKTTKKK